MTEWFDTAAIDAAVLVGGARAMSRGSIRIVARAKELAPVRKVFAGQDKKYRVRLKSIEEIESDRADRRALGLGPERTHIHPPTIVANRAPQLLSQRAVVSSDLHTGRRVKAHLALATAQARLDRRGRSELKTARATGNGQLGGHLRDQIYATPPEIAGRYIRVKIVSPAPYSKYQELGSAHNPAHPFMRPAAYENRDSLKDDVAREIIAEVRPLFVGRAEATIHMRLRGGVR